MCNSIHTIDNTFHILCIDTSMHNIAISWTVYDNANTILQHTEMTYKIDRMRKRSEYLIPSIEHLRTVIGASYHDLDCISCVIGPGSFTGIRNALAFVKGLIISSKTQAIGIRTHDVIAYQYQDYISTEVPLLVVKDARSKRYYTALYNTKHFNNIPIHDLTIEEITQTISKYNTVYCIGEAEAEITSIFKKNNITSTILFPDSHSYTALEALRILGIHQYQKKTHRITECTEPLYIRAEV